jgi:hypothetical protein
LRLSSGVEINLSKGHAPFEEEVGVCRTGRNREQRPAGGDEMMLLALTCDYRTIASSTLRAADRRKHFYYEM